MTRRRRIGFLTSVTLVAAVVLSGCAGIPDSGDVQTATGVAGSQNDQVIRVIPRPPRAGATPTEIVAGFLTASASFENDHAVARTYLSESASKTWVPDAGVAVYESDPGYQLATLGPNIVRMLALKSAGTISARGQYLQPLGSEDYRANFGVRKVGTQWRITDVPRGLILSSGDVARAYRSLDMFFLDITGGVLVPDPLFLPVQQAGIATALTKELLAGPTPWLAPAVRTAVPTGTKLAVGGVTVQDGVANVDLDERVLAAAGEDRRALAAQLTYTLSQLPDVQTVRITLNGVPFAIPGVGTVTSVSDWPTYDPNATPNDPSTYALDRGHLAIITASGNPVTGYFGTAKDLSAAAVSLDGQLIAGVRQLGATNEVRMGVAGVSNVPIAYSGRFVSSVSFDRLNSAWIADRSDSKTSVWVLRVGRAPVRVRIDELGSRSIAALRVSRDGARVALVVSAQPGEPGQLLIGRVERTSGTPVVAGLRRIENSLTEVSDVSWADDGTLLVLARRAGESTQAYLVGIDGDSIESAGSIPAMKTIAPCPGRPNLAGADSDTLWVDRGNGWRVATTGNVPLYPG